MKKLIVAGVICASLAVPSTSLGAAQSGPAGGPFFMAGAVALSVHDCLAEARATGRDAFAANYGTPDPLRNCVKQHVDQYATKINAAVQSCTGERQQLGAEIFGATYGGPIPFLNCVKSKLDSAPIPV